MIKYYGPKLKILKSLGVSFLPFLSSKKVINNKQPLKILLSYKKIYLQKIYLYLYHMYGIRNYQLLNYFKKIPTFIKNKTLYLGNLLNMRLDYILTYCGFCKTINQAKQFINHGFILLNGYKVTYPKIKIKLQDIITINFKLNKNIVHIIQTNISNTLQLIQTSFKLNLISYYSLFNYFQCLINIHTYSIYILRLFNLKELPSILTKIN